MEFKVEQLDLQKVVSIAQNCVGKKTTMPILSNFLITAQAGTLKLAASDLELTVVFNMPAEVRSPGSFTVNAKMFADIVRELSPGELNIRKSENERVEIISGSSRFKVLGISAEEYPALPGLSAKLESVMSSAQLSDMISKTIYATSVDETRANMNGVCFELEKSGKSGAVLKLVSTDGHRLSMVSRPVADFGLDNSIIVPRRALVEIKKALDTHGDVPVKMGVSGAFFELEIKDTKFSARLADSPFPSYTNVIPDKKGTRVEVDVEQLSQALRRVMLMVADRNKCVQIQFTRGSIILSSSSPDLGEATEAIQVEYDSGQLTLGVNASFIQDAINSVPGMNKIFIDLHGEDGPLMIKCPEDESYTAIVMPMRIV